MPAVRAHLLLCGLIAVYLTPSSGQFLENPKLFFRPMDDTFDTRLRGSFRTPLCVRLMMNCWEVMSGGTVCNERRIRFGSACTTLRSHRCTDQYQFGQFGYPYQWMQLLDELCTNTREVAAGDS